MAYQTPHVCHQQVFKKFCWENFEKCHRQALFWKKKKIPFVSDEKIELFTS